MARLKSLSREEMNADQAATFDAIVAAGGRLGGPYEAYIRIPPFMRLNQQMGNYLRSNSLLPRLRLIAVLLVVRHWGAGFAWAANAREALKEGLSQDVVDAINRKQIPIFHGLGDEVVFDLVSELLASNSVSEGTYSRAVTELGETTLVDLIVTVGFFNMVCITLVSFNIEAPENSDQTLLE
jgi:4-carboxymuconolactone decarboxylase